MPKSEIGALKDQLTDAATQYPPRKTDATTTRITRPYLINENYRLDRVNLILQDKDSKVLKVVVPNAAKSTLNYINSLDVRYAGVNLVKDGKRYDATKDGTKITYYIDATDSAITGVRDATYSQVVVYDKDNKPTFAMVWSNQGAQRRLLVFSKEPNPNKADGVYRAYAYAFVAAYQDASGFNLRSAVVASDANFFNTAAYGVWTQLAYDTSSGAFQSVESYRVADNATAPRVQARLITQGNNKAKGLVGLVETKDAVPPVRFFYFGDTDTSFELDFENSKPQEVEDSVFPKDIIGEFAAKDPDLVANPTAAKGLGPAKLDALIFKRKR